MSDVSVSSPLHRQLQGCSLYLIGMMASGKSSTARLLARRLGYRFVDTDTVIEQVAGESIPRLFEQIGEPGFRALETQVLRAISQHHSLVVATGGGVVVQPENWGILRQGIIVWLNIDRDQLLIRLDADNTQRPLLQTANPATALDTILEARLSLYSEADLQITIGAENLNEVADQILKCLSKQFRSLRDLTLLQTTAR